ncbi:MAG: hypothetical protein LAO31_19715 [Acidobacteriia bacterium]|nr:hypothetical protein [Terriglobia bacterium]
MSGQLARPNVDEILRGLKDFQRETVDYVFHRLYLDPDHTRRFLIADEVGLGKTLVARGLIAKAIDYLWHVDRIDIVYICSNADIARQNINRLNAGAGDSFSLPTRPTLLPIVISDLSKKKVNYISFTPGTGLDLTSGLGIIKERAVIYHLLDRAWGLSGAGPLNVLQGLAGKENFRETVHSLKKDHPIDQKLADEFGTILSSRNDLRTRFDQLCDHFSRARINIPEEQESERRKFVADIRALLAQTCIKALEPDLIILDEFQRFKYLLDDDDETGELARQLFNYSDEAGEARVLLLSATPYKMYTLTDEAGAEDHYQDFLRTLSFLQDNSNGTGDFESLLSEYRHELYRLGDGANARLPEIKKELEARLRRVMVRTERIGVSKDRDGMLTEILGQNSRLHADDLESYIALQNIGRMLEQGDLMEYWKSAPYLLSFMEDYELKSGFDDAIDSREGSGELARIISNARGLVIPWNEITSYSQIDPNNARLRGLIADTIEVGAWKLLWMPPSLPYYQPGGAFSDPGLARLTKRLVFSSWKVVPKVIATLLSYEAERLMIRSFEKDPQNPPENSPDARKRRRPLLRFTRTDERLSGMPVLGMIYPCVTFARKFDPLSFMPAEATKEGPPALGDVISLVQKRIEELLPSIIPSEQRPGPTDETWYWAAPILFDLQLEEGATRDWFASEGLAEEWQGEEGSEAEGEEESLWSAHVDKAKQLVAGEIQLGTLPQDLSHVLALMALAGPGVAALRALSRLCGGPSSLSNPAVRTSAATVGWAFLRLFNLPEATALLRGINSQEPYWERVLEYCVDGNLQSVLDEYVHILRESEGLMWKEAETVAEDVSSAACQALSLRTSTLGLDTIKLESDETISMEPKGLRARFALRLNEEKVDGTEQITRADQVRRSFNSPFWPFVLATTSIGQEGLDFHQYCHAVVHWNLPSNPVDIEQREGRIQRYKGHAIRKNVALRIGRPAVTKEFGDPWECLFSAAEQQRPADASDLIPYWVYQIEGGAKIERHVPALPLSRDMDRLNALRRSLVIYRMVFGQPRQEDLMNYLLTNVPASELLHLIEELRIDLSPPRSLTG